MTDTVFNDKLIDFTVFGKTYIPTSKDSIEYMENLLSTEKFSEKFIESEYCLIPHGKNAINLIQNSAEGEILNFEENSARDLTFHKRYFKFLHKIWEVLPINFRLRIPDNVFYKFIKHLKKQYTIVYQFRDAEKIKSNLKLLTERKKELKLTKKQIEKLAELFGRTEMIEYDSISFGRMTDKRFKDYVGEQIPFIYSDVIGRYYQDEAFDEKIREVEKGFKTFLKDIEE
jgi:hypothetical protein